VLSVATSTAMESTSIVVSVPSFVLPISTILDLVLDNILTREEVIKEDKTKSGKAWA
jgi:hypothetical protein